MGDKINPHEVRGLRKPKPKPAVGTRVMWVYGREDYVDYGEIGTVTSHTEDGFMVAIDDEQRFHKACYGSKSKRIGHAREARFTTDIVEPLDEVYRATAERFRRIADQWDLNASLIEQPEVTA